MALPIDSKQGFLRTPDRYRHDAFGHDGGIDGCARVRPHSGFDSTPTVPNARGRSVLGGEVLRSGFTIYAGNFVEIMAPDGWLWLDLHFASRLVKAGDIVDEGDPIGIVGNTGGGGALGSKATIGIHQHTSRCRDRAAVDRIINGRVRARYKGETPAQWAAAHGLSDPYPHIAESVKAKGALVAVSDEDWNQLVGKVDGLVQAFDNMAPTWRATRGDQLVTVDGTPVSRAQLTQQRVERLLGELGAIAQSSALSAEDTAALREVLLGIPEGGKWSWADRVRSGVNDSAEKLGEVLERLPEPPAAGR